MDASTLGAQGYVLKGMTFCCICGEFDYLKNDRCQMHQEYTYGKDGNLTLEEHQSGEYDDE